jgi:hypothetical protein
MCGRAFEPCYKLAYEIFIRTSNMALSQTDQVRQFNNCGIEENGDDHSFFLFLLSVGMLAGLTGILLLSKSSNNRISLETLRKAYEGLSPEDEQKI